MTDAPPDAIRDRLLEAVLLHVPFDGWSPEAFRRAAAEAGIEPGHARLACPRGALDLAVAFHRRGDAAMLARLDTPDFAALGMTAKITKGVRTRLEIAEGHEEAVRRATSMFALPHNAPEGARLMWETADRIWTAAGDTATDYNWYTKRLTLAGVLSSTLLHWLGDASPGKTATWAFLDRRIGDVMRIEKVKAKARGNPLARLALAGPKAALSLLRPPRRHGLPGSPE